MINYSRFSNFFQGVIMKTRSIFTVGLIFATLLLSSNVTFSQKLKQIKLPSPQLDRGRPLMQALKDRRTMRDFSTEMLSHQDLSNILWAAWGVNRSDLGKRTAPSWANWQEIDIYVATVEGVYLYNAQEHVLNQVLSEDIRRNISKSDFVTTAPLNFIYIADYSRMRASDEDKRFISGTDTGFISQNVYLYCASEGLATVVLGGINRDTLHKVMKLRDNQKVVLAQTIGYPEKK